MVAHFKLISNAQVLRDSSPQSELSIGHKTEQEKKAIESRRHGYFAQNNQRLEVMKLFLHCGDLNNPVKPKQAMVKWTSMVMEEFFRQGEKEKNLGS